MLCFTLINDWYFVLYMAREMEIIEGWDWAEKAIEETGG